MSSDELSPSGLFRRYGPMVYRRCLSLLGTAADAEEATQDIFIKAFKALDRYRPDARLSTWLYRIASNHCLNALRDRARRGELLREREAEVPVAGATGDVETQVVMRRLLAAAEPRQAEAALLVFVDGMSHQEAAKMMGVSRRTVGNLCERFTRWARELLDA